MSKDKLRFAANKKEFRDAFVAKKRAGYDVVELAAFREAMYHAYLSILSQKPTAIIAPLRGAEPLIKVIQLFASGERKSSQIPMIYYPKVGQMTMDIMPKYVEKIPQVTQNQWMKLKRNVSIVECLIGLCQEIKENKLD